jgi:glycosyltransferase involved in cell wall biosynthesis
MVTIIIPTAARPSMLRTALKSAAEQSARNKIECVYVSENGRSRDSESVCAEFSSLPIRYVYREPTSAMEHGRIFMRDCLQGELTAILHDDDWWAPNHLAQALAALESRPDAGVYGSAHFVVAGESSMLNCSGNLFPWFGAGYPAFEPVWELSRLNVLMAQLLGTIAHFSSMVVRTDILRKASYVFDLNNPFDNDRMLLFAISILGSVLFNPVPEVFVRNHGVQDCFRFDNEARIGHMRGTTRWMVETSGKSWEAVSKSFARRMALCPVEAVGTLKALAAREWCLPEMERQLSGLVAA